MDTGLYDMHTILSVKDGKKIRKSGRKMKMNPNPHMGAKKIMVMVSLPPPHSENEFYNFYHLQNIYNPYYESYITSFCFFFC